MERILSLIERYDVIILHRHKNPDGDALGSQIGLKQIILENYPGKKVYMAGDAAGRYSFMEDSVMDDVPDEVYENALAVILLEIGRNSTASPKKMTPTTIITTSRLYCSPGLMCVCERLVVLMPTDESRK